jgi:nucleotide-binding universal stress UspA family protein
VTITALLCTDGSDLAHAALARGMAVIGPPDRVVVATVVALTDPMDVVGTGMAGGVISPSAAAHQDALRLEGAAQVVEATARALGLDGAESAVLEGSPGPALCELATSLPASVIVIGTRGQGGLRRAVLGSVSDHVVRNAPCPVVVSSG